MLFRGKFKTRLGEYVIELTETTVSRRVDIFGEGKEYLVSVCEDKVKGNRQYSGDLDLYYIYERLMRDARLHRFTVDEIEESNDFEEGKVVFSCNQVSEKFIYNFKKENYEEVYRYLKSPESELELSLTDPNKNITAPHLFLKYQKIDIKKSNFNEDDLARSRLPTLAELREKYDLSWMKKKVYLWMDDIFMLNRYIKELLMELEKNPQLVVDIDTETTGLDYYYYPLGSETKDELVSIVITWKKDFAIYIPIKHKYETNIPKEQVMKLLLPILKYARLRTQYGAFDWKVFREERISEDEFLDINIAEDFLLQNFIIQPNPRAGSRSLKDKAWELLGIKQLSLSDLFPATKDSGKMEIRFELLPKELALFYACPDVDLMRIMSEMVTPLVPNVSETVYKAETRMMPIVASAEYYGLRIDMKHFEFEKKLCAQLAHDLQELIYTLAGYRFNLNSPDQVGHFLYDRLGCEMLLKSKSNPNKGSTSSKALKSLSKTKAKEPKNIFPDDITQEVRIKLPDGSIKEENRKILEAKTLNAKEYPEIDILIEYRNYSKLLTSFFNSIEESNKGGRLYSWINQTGAQTGRIISPLQTLPPFIKHMIIPDTSEHGWAIMDYKQVELRLMFGLAEEEELIALSENPDNDIHRIVAALIHRKEIWEISSSDRKKSKTLNFGIPYSLGDRSLAEALYGLARTEEDMMENVRKARQDKRQFFDAMPRVERLFIDAKEEVRRQGCIFTRTGRGAFYENILTEINKGKIARTLRQAGNFMIQAFGADLFKIGTSNFQERIRQREWHKTVKVTNAITGDFEGEFPKVRPAFFAHDELGSNYHKKTIHPCQVLYELRNTMQIKMKGFPTLFIGPCIVSNWGDAKEDKYEIPIGLLDRFCDEVEAGMYTEPIPNPEEWIYTEIVKFKATGYLAYLKELAQQLQAEGTAVTPENISKIFRHGVLSHDMMAMYDDDLFTEEVGHKPAHVEHLEWSVVKYIEESQSMPQILGGEVKETNDVFANRVISINPMESLTETTSENIFDDMFSTEGHQTIEITPSASKPKSNVVQFKTPQTTAFSDDKDEMLEFVDELDEYSNPLDVNVAYEFDDTSDDEYSESYALMYEGAIAEEEYVTRVEEILQGFSDYVYTIARKKVIKVGGISKEDLASLVAYLKELHKDKGLYDVVFMLNQNMIPTELKVDKIDDAMVDLIISKSRDKINNN